MSNPSGKGEGHSSRAAGFLFLMVTSVGWGVNWPISKYLLTELPPLTMRGLGGLIGALLLALLALARRESLLVPRHLWPRLIGISLLTVGVWTGLIGLSLLWLNAGEAAVLAASNPVWVSLLAWPMLSERLSITRIAALLVAIAGLAILFGVDGFSASAGKLPGILLALTATMGVAVGTILTKRFPLQMPAIAVATWQIGCACLVVTAAGFIFETAHFDRLSPLGWALLGYVVVIQFCVCYACWFAALKRLPASTASVGTLVIPVVGVLASAIALHEPLGLREILALALTLGAVAIAARG
jgi:probable blue pigment (indigoidine) exporter